MKENTEELCYGYRLNTYISVGLIGSGVVCIALAIAFTLLAHSIWVLVLCWVLGVILFILGVFWHFSITVMTTPAKFRMVGDNFLSMLRAVWDGKGKVLDIGTGNGRVAVLVAGQSPEA